MKTDKAHKKLAKLISAYVGMAKVGDINSCAIVVTNTAHRETIIDAFIPENVNRMEVAKGLKVLREKIQRGEEEGGAILGWKEGDE